MRKRMGDLLVGEGLITEEQLREALVEQGMSGKRLGDVLIQQQLISEKQLIELLEMQLGIRHVELYKEKLDSKAIHLVTQRFADQHLLMPIRIENGKLLVAMADPFDYDAINELQMMTGLRVEPVIASQSEVRTAIKRYIGMQETVHQMIRTSAPPEGERVEQHQDQTADAPVVKLVNQLLEQAIQLGASDIHVDPQDEELRIRYRIDGLMRTERALPAHMHGVVSARLKVMAGLDVAERRLPQDGRIELGGDYRYIDIRISTLPTVYGEKIVLRILNHNAFLTDIEKLALSPANLERVRKTLTASSGMVLLTGPTGSGKTTTLYAALSHLNREDVNIITVEDPVEIQLAGVNQVQVNPVTGLSYARALRAMLRQDPNVVMIGEIRDLETAEIAVRAAMTGHQVLSTLHTNSAVNAITRLMDMGVESFLVASSLSCVIAQRLVRNVCERCAEDIVPTETEIELLREHGITEFQLKRGAGCRSCDHSGYKGRMAIHEVLVIDDEISSLILQRRPDFEYLEVALRKGMVPMIKDGLLKAASGRTTITEIIRVL